jgi:hypothetical protein
VLLHDTLKQKNGCHFNLGSIVKIYKQILNKIISNAKVKETFVKTKWEPEFLVFFPVPTVAMGSPSGDL